MFYAEICKQYAIILFSSASILNAAVPNPVRLTASQIFMYPSNYIKRLCVCVCVCVRMSRSLLSCIKSVWNAGGIVRTVSARAFYIPSFKKFHARVHGISRNFTQFSRILGYCSHFWANFNMLGIKMHVLELRN